MGARLPEAARRNRRWLTLLGVLLAALAVGCWDPWYGYRATAPCPGAGVERVQRALAGDAGRQTRRIEDRNVGIRIGRFPIATFWCERGGVTASVHVLRDPDELEVAVGVGGRGDADELSQAKAQAEYGCARLSREMPEVGPWRLEDNTDRSIFDLVPLAWWALSMGLVIWIIVRKAGVRRPA